MTTQLAQAPPEQQFHFADIALTELAKAYQAEARMASGEIGSPGHWSLAVGGYTQQILQMKEYMAAGMPVEILTLPDAAPAIVVGAHRIMLTHPRPDLQAAFEQDILEQYCQSGNCQTFSDEQHSFAEEDILPQRRQTIRPAWEFTEKGPACSYDSLRIAFALETKLDQARVICRHFFSEAKYLLDEIRWRQQRGVVIEWSQLHIGLLPDISQHEVRLNTVGDVAVMELPLLYGTPELLSAVKPWLEAQLSPQPSALRLEANRFTWDLSAIAE